MKLRLEIQRADGLPISSWEHEFDERGVDVITTADQADFIMTSGLTYEEWERLGLARQLGVRFHAKVTP